MYRKYKLFSAIIFSIFCLSSVAFADLKTLTGSVTADGESTPKQLSTLLDAQKAAESGNIINVQNNNQIANNTSGGSNATIGFSTHLPDESFINVRKDNTTQSI